MRILSVTCKDFKTFTSQSFDFNDRNLILGDNFQGKTTIRDLIIFAIHGTTATGSPQTDLFIRKGAKKAEVTLVGEFNDGKHEIVRVKGAKSELYLDGQKVAQAEIDKLVGEKERFLTVFVPGYFTSLSDKDGRAMVMNLIQPPKQEEVLAHLLEEERKLLEHENLRDPDELAKEKRAEIKASQAEVNRVEGKLEVLREQAAKELPELKKFDGVELAELRQKLESATAGTANRIKELRAELSAMGREYKMLKGQIQELPQAPYHTGDPCPVCAQTMDGDALENALRHHTNEVAKLQQRNIEIAEKCKSIAAQGNQLKPQLDQLEDEYIALKDNTEIQERIAELEAEEREVHQHNGYVNRLRIEKTEAQAEIAKAEAYLKELQEEQFTLSETVKAIGSYRAKLAEMQVSQLKQHLNRVDIELFKITKNTGEVKDCFTITYDGKEYKSLSYSEQIRANLEIATLFNKVLGYDVPVFIDNGESITHFDDPYASQVFVVKVVEGASLEVINDGEKAEGSVA